MKTSIRILTTALVGLASATAIASVVTLQSRLENVVGYAGDRAGNLPIVLHETDQTKYLAFGDATGATWFYTDGDVVPDDAWLGACAVDAAGGPIECDADYGHTLVSSYEILQDDGADPTELKVACSSGLDGASKRCQIWWSSGLATCIECTSPNPDDCYVVPATHC